MKKSQFKSRLKSAVAWDQVPELSEEDIDNLVELSRTQDSNGNVAEEVDMWEPGTYYSVGSSVVNEKKEAFICVVGGVSGAISPKRVSKHQGTYVDGECEWVFNGTTRWTPTYDFNRAAYEAWGLKAAKAASMISFTADGARYDRDQLLSNCEAMQRKYAINASPRTRRSTRVYPIIVEVVKHVDD